MDKILRYYISEIVSKSVANSQMFNWGEVLASKGIKTEFVIFSRSKEKVGQMTKDTKQPIIIIPIIKFFLIRNMVHFFTFIFLYVKARIKYQKVIFQTRTQSVAPSLAILRFLPGLKVISDIRGFELEHYDLHSYRSRLKLLSFDVYTWMALHTADKIFCVSNPLVSILSERYKIMNKEIFAVFGGVADENYFYYNNALRDQLKTLYSVENKILLLYSGMLNKSWQMPEKYFDFFSALQQQQSNLILVLITPNTEIANKLKEKYNIADKSIIIKESTYADLASYYNMADFGLLFRKNEIVNRVASPTKFSEYTLCGLPVIISSNIGDFSGDIKKSGFGYVIKNTDLIIEETKDINQFISQFKTERLTIATESKKIYSKQSQLNRLLDIYLSV